MRPGNNSIRLLGATRAKGKMYEYSVPTEYHIELPKDPARLFDLAIGNLGDLSYHLNAKVKEHKKIESLTADLMFSARFFDAYIESRLNPNMDNYITLLAASAFYLCDSPGSSYVWIKKMQINTSLDYSGVDDLVAWLLRGNVEAKIKFPESPLKVSLLRIASLFREFVTNGPPAEGLFDATRELRRLAYICGDARELLLADVAGAIVHKKIENSVWTILPEASGVSSDNWKNAFKKRDFIKELWPAQKILAANKVFSGASAIVQMPTSAGKTKSVEIVIRSVFLRDDSELCVVIAPFRALCHEIRITLSKSFRGEGVSVDELSDVFQDDFEFENILDSKVKQILVVTPEKLLYVLRQSPEIAGKISLLILDEAHQFDSGIRGVTYELLIASLRPLIPNAAQKILISAVISNGDVIGKWLNGIDGKVVTGNMLNSTYRTIGFASWTKSLGMVEYVQSTDVEAQDFFVPRVIESHQLKKKKRERTDRVFPEKENGGSVALYLGLKLVKNGSVALFCGLKSTASTIGKSFVEAYERGFSFPAPIEFSNETELKKISNLYGKHLGDDAIESTCAKFGVLTHHAGIPHGVRLSVEHAMREGLAKFVLCTSTLAQGVNLPIKYLLFTSIYQAGEKIKVRDFHNLIGRAGRSGMQTEGSILFADPEVYDKRKTRYDGWRWKEVKHLLNPTNSEPCVSSLLSILDPKIKNAKKDNELEIGILDFLFSQLDDPTQSEKWAKEAAKKYASSGFDEKTVRRQLDAKARVLSAIESYLVSMLTQYEFEDSEEMVTELATETLAYSLASDAQRKQLVKLFTKILKKIEKLNLSDDRKISYGKTLLGLDELLKIEEWIENNAFQLLDAVDSEEQLLAIIWPLLEELISDSDFKKCFPQECRQMLALGWIAGVPFHKLLETIQEQGAFIRANTQKREFTIQHVVDICEGGFAYDGMLIVGAIAELVDKNDQLNDTTVSEMLWTLQKRLKYGLETNLSILIYEYGFADRIVAVDVARVVSDKTINSKLTLREFLESELELVESVLDKYPSYFRAVLGV